MAGYTIGNIIRKNRLSRGNPDGLALVFEDQRLTYDELDRRVDQVASGLQAHGFVQGDRVAIFSKNRVEWVETFFAVARLGGVVVPVNYLFKAAELSHAITDSEARWVVIEGDLLGVLEPIRDDHPNLQIVVVEGELDGAHRFAEIRESGDPAGVDVLSDLDDLFMLQYTSGTTGFPKAAMHTHAGVLLNMITQPYDLGMRPDDVYLSVPALCWAAGLHDYTLATWWLGGTVVLNPSRDLDPHALCALVERERATIIVLVPSVIRLILASGALDEHDLSSLRISMTGAEPITTEMLDQLADKIPGCATLQGYGQSEFPIFMTVLLADEARTKAGSAGKPTSLVEMRVVDADGNDAPTGQEGDIVSRSAVTMKGYWGKEDVTAETMVNGWLQSGDRGYVDEDGYLFIAGRSKDMIITGGLNVYPAEVERVITDQAGVREAAIVAVPHERLGEVGKAIVVAEKGHDVDLDALRDHVKTQVATYKVPREWVLREEPLPRTASGKVRKYILKDESS
jgi:fatty-acyl-CoA synthase